MRPPEVHLVRGRGAVFLISSKMLSRGKTVVGEVMWWQMKGKYLC
jgi:hypothetical protein